MNGWFVVLRSRLEIETVCQDGRGMSGESKRREFRKDDDEESPALWNPSLSGRKPLLRQLFC
jgi:hypothetical protein